MSPELWTILGLSLKVALGATLLMGLPGVLLGYLLARKSFRGKRFLSALLGLPMVLPPTAVGLLLLQLLSPQGPLGYDLDILLTWRAALLAAGVMALPLVVRTSRVAFEEVDPRLEQMARTLGHGPMQTFVRFSLPMAARGIAAALLLGFTRALGEYGATVTIAGSIPGETETLASAIFNAQLQSDHGQAKVLMLISLGVGLGSIWISESLVQGASKGRRPR